jgi:peptide/nickel transport system ATP-binding protein
VSGKEKEFIVDVKGMKKYFPIQAGFLKKTVGYVKAVDNVDINIRHGETFGLVGESGCGKTTLGRCLLRAIEPTAGEILYDNGGEEMMNISKLGHKELRGIHKDMQLIFQDPYSSLNPRMTILNIVGEPLICNGIAKGKALRERVKELIEMVGLDSRHLERYPHAFSGGQRQRIGIARALATNPKFIVCDEAVSALDVSVQAQILNLLQDLQQKLKLSYLFISHDLGVIQHTSDRVGVMYVGRMVELATSKELFTKPMHPYTEALLSAKPIPDPRSKSKRIILTGEVANPAKPPSGCYFNPRCRFATENCKHDIPPLTEVSPGHFVACHKAKKLELKGVLSRG